MPWQRCRSRKGPSHMQRVARLSATTSTPILESGDCRLSGDEMGEGSCRASLKLKIASQGPSRWLGAVKRP